MKFYCERNVYIRELQEVINHISSIHYDIRFVKDTISKHGWFNFFDQKETIPKDKAVKQFRALIDNFRMTAMRLDTKETGLFWNIWDIAVFVRYAEKLLLYDNELDQRLFYVDSAMDAKEQKLVIDKPQYTIYIRLEERFLEDTKESIEVKHIKVKRKIGKKMENDFVIVNDNPKFNDDSDSYLLYQIENLLRETMIKTLDKIIIKLEDQFNEIARKMGWKSKIDEDW